MRCGTQGACPGGRRQARRQVETVQAATLVPGDIVKIRLGVIVPADLRMVKGDYASIDQAANTSSLDATP